MSLSVAVVEGNPQRFTFPVEKRWCSSTDMFGGTTFGAVIEALEMSAGLPLLTASAQFIRTAQIGAMLDIETKTLATGKLTTQIQAMARQDNHDVCSVAAALGELPLGADETGGFPSVPAPDMSQPRTYMRPVPGSFATTLDVRIAEVDQIGCRIWARWPAGGSGPMSAAVLAIFADHPPYGIGLVRGTEWYGLTLDSSLRMAAPLHGIDANSWILVDMKFSAISARFAHCAAELWSQSGRLIALAAQTMRLRQWQHAPENRQTNLRSG